MQLRGDLNADGSVDFQDFLDLSQQFGMEVDQAFAGGDLDGSGIVDMSDFLILAQNFGE